jgi:hypothetical protein
MRVAVGREVGTIMVGITMVGKLVRGKGVTLGIPPPIGVADGVSGVAVTICWVAGEKVGVGACCGAVPHRKMPAQ